MSTTHAVTIGDREFTLSPIKLGTMRKGTVMASLKQLTTLGTRANGTGIDPDDLNAMLNVIASVATPDGITQAIDELDMMDGIEQITTLFPIVMRLSNFTKDRESVPGEAESPVTSISPGSTDSLSPQPDGPTETSTT